MPFASDRLAEIEVILPAARAVGVRAHCDVGDVAAKVVNVGIEAAEKDGIRPKIAFESKALGFYLMRWDAELAEQPGYEHPERVRNFHRLPRNCALMRSTRAGGTPSMTAREILSAGSCARSLRAWIIRSSVRISSAG